jgi:K+-transporting ATPase ATPase C chain
MFAGVYAGLGTLNIMRLATPESAILSAVIFNALIIIGLIPLALRGVRYKPSSAASMLRRNLGIYGLGGILAPFIGIKVIATCWCPRSPASASEGGFLMATRTTPAVRQYAAALRAFLALTAILGLIYPLAMTGIAQAAFSGNSGGSLVTRDGQTVGSDLIGQAFTRPVIADGQPQEDAGGNPVLEPDPVFFQGRPSAAGTGYDPLSTSASNLGPENEDLIAAITARRARAAELDGVAPEEVAPDALLASGSGIDPHISPAYAQQQVTRVARERRLSTGEVRALVAEHTKGRVFGFLGEPRVNVLELNLALDELAR